MNEILIFPKLAEWQCIGWLQCQAGGNAAKFKLAEFCLHNSVYTEMAKKVCARLRDLTSGRGGDFTQPGANFFGHLCIVCRQLTNYVLNC